MFPLGDEVRASGVSSIFVMTSNSTTRSVRKDFISIYNLTFPRHLLLFGSSSSNWTLDVRPFSRYINLFTNYKLSLESL